MVARNGFTLIELSIVLVIIGLIAGGALVGQDLIKAAELRRAISTVEKYGTAFNTFRTKYNCMAGDCLNAVNLGIGTFNGNGNGTIDGLHTPAAATGGQVSICSTCAALPTFPSYSEISMVMEELSRSGLVKDQLKVWASGSDDAPNAYPYSMLPTFGVRPQITFYIVSFNGQEYLRTYMGGPGGGIIGGAIDNSGWSLTPMEASSITQKMGDGTAGRNFSSFAITSSVAGVNSAHTTGANYNLFADLPNLKSLAVAAVICVDDTGGVYTWYTANTLPTCDLAFRL